MVREAASMGTVILVHGGGHRVNSLGQRYGVEQKFVTSPEGYRSRYTDWETMEFFSMVMRGLVAMDILREMRACGRDAISLTGLDMGLIRGERKKRLVVLNERGRRMVIDGGFTGRPTHLRADVLTGIMSSGAVPVIAPIICGEENEPLNVDGDRLAAFIASRMRADALVLLTNVPGVVLDGQVLNKIDRSNYDAVLQRVGNGMDKKLMAAREAVEGGARLAVIAQGSSENAISRAISGASGTVVTWT